MRSAMCAASPSCLEGSPLMWMVPLHLHVNLNADDDDNVWRSVVKKIKSRAHSATDLSLYN